MRDLKLHLAARLLVCAFGSSAFAGWFTKTPIPYPCEYPASGVIGGEIYIAGGALSTTLRTDSCFKYSPTANSWTRLADMPSRGEGIGTGGLAVNGKLYAISGLSRGGVNQEFTQSTNTWATRASMPTTTYWYASAQWNSQIYCMGDHTGSSVYRTAQCYTPATNTWTTLNQMPTARGCASAAAHNGDIYVFGGYTGSAALSVVEKYSTATGQWSTGLAPMPTARYHTAAVTLNGKIYVIGGISGSTGLSIVEIYDPATNSWATGEPMPTPRWGLVAEVVNGKIYAIGGRNSSAYQNVVEEYTPASGPQTLEWTRVPQTSPWSARCLHTALVFNNQMWMMGGWTGSAYLNDVWRSTDGVNWTQVTSSAPWARRSSHASVVFNNRMWVIAGWNGSGMNDVWWSTDGATWTRATAAAPWSRRARPTVVVMNGKMWLMGGDAGGQEVWSSTDGAAWTREATPPWAGRYSHSSEVYAGSMWLMGGTMPRNDVWRSSNGSTWTRTAASAAWPARWGQVSVVHDNKLWVMGGQGGTSTFYNDLWSSTDGATWAQATATSVWSPRLYHAGVVFNGRVWVFGGQFGTSTFYNDVWYTGTTSGGDPRIAISPGAFAVDLTRGQSADRTLTVRNIGGGALTWTITENPSVGWLSENPAGGSVQAGQQANLTLHFSTAGLNPGPYNTTLILTSNDPSTPTIHVPVHLDVAAPRRPWTIIVYACGDNDLELSQLWHINELESKARPDLYNVVVLFDRHPNSLESEGFTSRSGDWSNSRAFVMRRGSDQWTIESDILFEHPEINMGDPNSLASFVGWGAEYYPADHYCLAIWDHGNGWYESQRPFDSYASDWTNNDDMGVADGEFESALRQIRARLGRNLDVLFFDACLMGMLEIDHIAHGYVDFIVHSPMVVDGRSGTRVLGFPYDYLLEWLNSNPSAAPSVLSRVIPFEYLRSHLPGAPKYDDEVSGVMSSFDLTPFYRRGFLARLNAFAHELIKAGGKDRADVVAARNCALNYDYAPGNILGHVDLYDFADQVDVRDIGGAGSRLDLAARDLKATIDWGFTQGYSYEEHFSSPRGQRVDRTRGRSIYYPVGMPDPTYCGLQFSRDNLWYAFISGCTSLPPELLLRLADVTGGKSAVDFVRPGELVDVELCVANFSLDSARGVRGRLFTDDANVDIVGDGTVTFSDLGSLDSSFAAAPARISVHGDAPVGRRIPIWLALEANGGGYCDTTCFGLVVGDTDPSSRWTLGAAVPSLDPSRNIKGGGALSSGSDGDVFVLKGNNSTEFYAFDVKSASWSQQDSLPRSGASGRNKAVKKGGALCFADGMVHACKGNNSLEFWRYDPRRAPGTCWAQMPDVPAGSKMLKGGTGLAPIVVADTTYIFLLKGSNTREFYRFNTNRGVWAAVATAPAGLSGRSFKAGSCIAGDNFGTVYALKANENEFYAYNTLTDSWKTLRPLPFNGVGGRKRKAKDGAALAVDPMGVVWCLKGGNSHEFWAYDIAQDTWAEVDSIPSAPSGKRVGSGGSLAYLDGVVYALKGKNTPEFWQYTPGESEWTQNSRGGLMAERLGLPTRLMLYPNQPNPTRGATTVRFALPRAGRVEVRFYDVTGREVRTLLDGEVGAGTHHLRWDGCDGRGRSVAQGSYFCVLYYNSEKVQRKVLLLR